MIKHALQLDSSVTLNNGIEIPVFGFGTWDLATGQRGLDALHTALHTGYRLIDTARAYYNEELVGEAIRRSGINRGKLFITSKLWNTEHGYDEARRACDKSLTALQLDYIDLYLIHWPGSGRNRETWRALVDLMQEGKCRAVGVSNFSESDIEEILDSSGVTPSVNQIRFNIYDHPIALSNFCHQHGIAVQAYSPLVRGRALHDESVMAIAKRHNKTPAQVLLRWVLQHDALVIHKSSTPQRIEQNADVFDFELSEQEMLQLNRLSQ